MASSPIQDDLHIKTLVPKPGITVWYSRIPDILDRILRNGNYHNFKPRVNEIFKKNDFNQPIFCEDELHIINGFKALKKQIEWICGRFLIKKMASCFFLRGMPLDHILIAAMDEGAPFLSGIPQIPISLSHSHSYTAAASSTNPYQSIGIDIEWIAPMPGTSFLNAAFTANELKSLEKNAFSVFKQWTIKEAYLKYIKKGFHESLHKVEVIGNEIFHHQVKADVDIFCHAMDSDYVLSLVSRRV